MNNKLINFMAFVVGGIVGSAVTWKYVRNKYERIAQEEIDSVKEVFAKRENPIDDVAENIVVKAKRAKEKPDISEYAALLHKQGYTNYSGVGGEDRKEVEPMVDRPYTIAPEDFGEFEDYERISLTYYTDQFLADENDDLVEDVDEIVGLDSLNGFGEYEDDSVFVRNDRLKCDYEILLDQRTYSDIIKMKPHQMEE